MMPTAHLTDADFWRNRGVELFDNAVYWARRARENRAGAQAGGLGCRRDALHCEKRVRNLAVRAEILAKCEADRKVPA